MTKQESFKRRVRARMEKTGERYVAARRALIDQADGRKRTWVAEPELGDDAVRAATGRGWDEWCDVLDRRPDPSTDHAAIAAYLAETLGVDPWWSQSVTVGYERITGLRLPYQRPDGTFTAGKSATIAGDADMVRKILLSDEHRPEPLPRVRHRTPVPARDQVDPDLGRAGGGPHRLGAP